MDCVKEEGGRKGDLVVDCGLPAATKRANLWLSLAALTNSSSFLTWLRICTVSRKVSWPCWPCLLA